MLPDKHGKNLIFSPLEADFFTAKVLRDSVVRLRRTLASGCGTRPSAIARTGSDILVVLDIFCEDVKDSLITQAASPKIGTRCEKIRFFFDGFKKLFWVAFNMR